MDWTFGIITDGKNDERLKLIIESILIQDIKTNYEIRIVGGNNQIHPIVKHKPFNENEKLAWITRKKNIIAHEAKYDNICLLHDYVSLDQNWCKNFENFGDNWDICVNRMILPDGSRWRDWVTFDTSKGYVDGLPHAATIRYLDYNDHSQTNIQYVSGTAYCIKKNFAIKYSLNETKSWGNSEDVDLAFRAREFWNLKCNPYSQFKLLKFKEIWPPRQKDIYNWKNNGFST